MKTYYPRWQKERLKRALEKRRVVVLEGARQTGKTELAQRLELPNAEYRTLDAEALKNAARADPDGFVRSNPGTLIIDEIQRAPGIR